MALVSELEGVVEGLAEHDPDDEAWRPLHQYLVIIKVGRGSNLGSDISRRRAAARKATFLQYMRVCLHSARS